MSELQPCEWTLDRIEPYLDGDLDAGERAALESHCTTCAACARELSLSIRIRREFRSMPVFDAPRAVMEAAASEARSSNVIPLRLPRSRRQLVLPALAAAIAVVATALWLQQVRQPEYTEADIQRARAEMALAFSYVDRYSDGVVREDVIDKRVMPHIERAIRSNESNVTSPPPGRS